jgi:hypothetical protein
MTAAYHVFPNVSQLALTKALSLNGVDTLKVALYQTGTVTWNGTTEAYTTLSGLVTGASLTEVSSSGYAAGGVALTSVTVATSGLVTTLTCANPSWTGVTFTAQFAVFYDSSVSSDLLCYADFGAGVPVTSGTFTLGISGSGLITWTAS